MRKQLACGIVLSVVVAAFFTLSGIERTEAAEETKGMVSHDVYFALKDNSAAAKKKLVDACKKYLSKHPGEVFFAAGTIAEDLNREVNDRAFDVALHIVFKDKAAHDAYQNAERHKQFIEENKDNWKKVRVFDSVVSK
ncbi:MAG TPA: Dabb family protein [Gemmataceae bacterium]|nr:Dabb family protein [Gemmataceae bacterium]